MNRRSLSQAGQRSVTGAERRRQEKYARLIKNAMPGNSTQEGFQAVADHLSSEQDFGPLERILKVLDPSKLPSIDPQAFDALGFEQLGSMHDSVFALVPLFQSLMYAQRRPSKLETYVRACMQVLLEHWHGVVHCMTFLITHCASQSSEPKLVCQDCADALLPILSVSKDDPLKQELLSISGTAKLIYSILCHADRQTGKYRILRPVNATRVPCSMAHLLKETMSHKAAWDVMKLEWESQISSTRRQYALALIGRVKQLVEMADSSNMTAIARSVFWLVGASAIMARDPRRLPFNDLERQNFLSELAASLTDLALKAQSVESDDHRCWAEISASMLALVGVALNHSLNPNRYIPRVIRGGMVRCAGLCLPWDDPSLAFGTTPAVKVLRAILPFFTLSGAFIVASNNHDFDYFFDAEHKAELPPHVQRICREVREVVLRARHAFLGTHLSEVSLCSNLQHPASADAVPGCEVQTTAYKTCGGCHSTFYCSITCQVEDWSNHHSRECEALRKTYLHFNSHRMWAHFSIWRDHILYLQALVNFTLPPLPEYCKARVAGAVCEGEQDMQDARHRAPQPYSSEATILVFDLADLDSPCPKESHKMTLQTYYTTRKLGSSILESRIQQCIRSALDYPEKFLLVEVVFPFSNTCAMRLLAKMSYAPGALQCDGYKVENSVFWVARIEMGAPGQI